jgi:ornithine decarboxylase
MRAVPCIDALAAEAPEAPITVARPHLAARAGRWFLANFPGEVFYAVKANPAPWALDALWDAGVRCFDVASETEVRAIAARYAGARLAFTHPVKSRGAIRRAYREHGVRVFALDSLGELEKIREETGDARDLKLLVRITVPGDHAQHRLDRKFGVSGEAATALLCATRHYADELGVAFHVGSQCLQPAAYRLATLTAAGLIREAGVTVDIVDVGGGFPSVYADRRPPALAHYVSEIATAFEDMPVLANADLWCEPGRALVAEAGAELVRVELRKDHQLYINDGSYGALFDAAHCGVRFPARLLRASDAPLAAFELYGPTCDSIDHMPGPFLLPADMREGDHIEIGMTGAYGAALASAFNGFGATETVIAEDGPLHSLYDEEVSERRRAAR